MISCITDHKSMSDQFVQQKLTIKQMCVICINGYIGGGGPGSIHYIPVSVAEAEIVEESTSEGNLRTEVRLHLQIAVSHLAFMIG